MPLYLKIIAGGFSGCIAQAIANPADLVKVRMIGQTMTNTSEKAVQSKWFIPTLIESMHIFIYY